ncbi:MAG: hypothetical protein MZU97_17580 [Bacillus subtilis]|nr:hypothetical protein [Bacillus subtilis]
MHRHGRVFETDGIPCVLAAIRSKSTPRPCHYRFSKRRVDSAIPPTDSGAWQCARGGSFGTLRLELPYRRQTRVRRQDRGTMAFYVPYESRRLVETVPSAFLADPNRQKYVYDWKAQKVALLWDGFDLEGVVFDLKLSAYLVNPEQHQGRLSASYPPLFDCHDVHIRRRSLRQRREVPSPRSDRGNRQPRRLTKAAAIYKLVEPARLKKLKNMVKPICLTRWSCPLARTLAKMEFAGISIDEAALDEFGARSLSALASPRPRHLSPCRPRNSTSTVPNNWAWSCSKR